jgi:hypothetical protein
LKLLAVVKLNAIVITGCPAKASKVLHFVDLLWFFVAVVATKWFGNWRHKVKFLKEPLNLRGRDCSNREPISHSMLVNGDLSGDCSFSLGRPNAQVLNHSTTKFFLNWLRDDPPVRVVFAPLVEEFNFNSHFYNT